MSYKLSNYTHMLKSLEMWQERLKLDDMVALATVLVNNYDCPCVVAGHLVGNKYGYTPELNNWLKNLKDFSNNNVILKEDDEIQDI